MQAPLALPGNGSENRRITSPLPLASFRIPEGHFNTFQCKERDSQRMARSAYFVPSGRKTWPFRQDIREMYPSTAFFQPKAYKMRLSRQNRLSEGTFQRDLARKPPSGCARVQNVLFLPRRRKDWSIPASNWASSPYRLHPPIGKGRFAHPKEPAPPYAFIITPTDWIQTQACEGPMIAASLPAIGFRTKLAEALPMLAAPLARDDRRQIAAAVLPHARGITA